MKPIAAALAGALIFPLTIFAAQPSAAALGQFQVSYQDTGVVDSELPVTIFVQSGSGSCTLALIGPERGPKKVAQVNKGRNPVSLSTQDLSPGVYRLHVECGAGRKLVVGPIDLVPAGELPGASCWIRDAGFSFNDPLRASVGAVLTNKSSVFAAHKVVARFALLTPTGALLSRSIPVPVIPPGGTIFVGIDGWNVGDISPGAIQAKSACETARKWSPTLSATGTVTQSDGKAKVMATISNTLSKPLSKDAVVSYILRDADGETMGGGLRPLGVSIPVGGQIEWSHVTAADPEYAVSAEVVVAQAKKK